MSINIKLTKKEIDIAEWALDAMQDTTRADDPDSNYGYDDLPLVGRGMMFIGSPFALNDLLYRVEDQYIDMAEMQRRNEGTNVTQDIKYARSLSEKIKHAIEVLSRPFPGMVEEKPAPILFDSHCEKAIRAFEKAGYKVDYSYDPVYVRTVYITHPEKEVIGQELRGILGDTLTSLGMRLTPFEGGKIIDFYERGKATESVKTPAKHWFIVAIFRHLAKHDDFKLQHDYWKAAADRQYAAGSGFASYQYKAIAAHELAVARMEIARLLILLISPPLFQSALDLQNSGKIDRFTEAGS